VIAALDDAAVIRQIRSASMTVDRRCAMTSVYAARDAVELGLDRFSDRESRAEVASSGLGCAV
jgi:hypothetical protein